jgi:dolichol-phosphate mannosyltransferase
MSGNSPFSGFTTLLCIVIFFSGIQIILLSIVGEYVWRILDEVKRRPNYIVKDIF